MLSIPSPPTVVGAFLPPIILGATKKRALSTIPADKAEDKTSPPPSSKRLLIPISPNFFISSLRSTLPPLSPAMRTSAPAFSSSFIFPIVAYFVVTIIVFGLPERILASRGTLAWLSRTILSGFSLSFPSFILSSGLSLTTVLIPTRTASTSERSLRTYLLAFVPVIHLDSPLRVAIFPSRLIAIFAMTNGSLILINLMKTSFICRALSSRMPVFTFIPADLRWRTPSPEFNGFGSFIAIITSFIPAFIILSVQGGVLPQ